MKGTYRCLLCPLSFFNQKQNALRHLNKFHRGEEVSAIIETVDEAGVGRYECYICGKEYTTPAHVRRHIRSNHEKVEGAHQCHKCLKSFRDGYGLTRHILTVHNKEKTCICSVCGVSYADRSGLRRHTLKCH